MRVYLDICCSRRPFDDQRQPRIREEAAAVAAIMALAETGEIELVRSPALSLVPEVEVRAAALVALGFPPLDALHLALAEQAAAAWFLTCDDRLTRLAARHREELRLEVALPQVVAWRSRR
ncbi:MAG TPA: PIN domain-containing protein [Thermoanaerobaculia bacterium]|nr:PIN domain-containing protein [Thermoanaerobaculia bacterium]